MKPKYQQVEQFLLYQLKNGEFKEGDKFYSEAELKEKFSVSSATVIKAINELVTKGLLVRQQGKGTFVSKARQGKLVKFFDHEKVTDADEQVQVYSIEKEHEPRILSELRLEDDQDYYHITRIRMANQLPVYVQHTYLLSEYFNDLALFDQDYYSSIYERIREDSGIDLFNIDMDETTEIVFPVPALEQKLMALEDKHQPAAFIKRHSYLFDNKVIEYVESYKRWDYFEFQIKTI